jgi:hypothetical protein
MPSALALTSRTSPRETSMTTIYIWPDGTYAETSAELEELLQWKSDDYRTVTLDDTFDLEKQLLGEDDDEISRPA